MAVGVGVSGSACGYVSEDLLLGLMGFMYGCRGREAVDCGSCGRGCRVLASKLLCVGETRVLHDWDEGAGGAWMFCRDTVVV